MNKTAKSILSIFFIGAVAMVSCKKSNSKTPSENLQGTWILTKEYVDHNSNGIMDANEMTSDSILTNTKVTYVFTPDGIVDISLNGSLASTGTWKLIYNNTYLQITETSAVSVDNIYSHIESIGGTNFEMKDTTDAANGGTTWLYFTKQ